MIQPKLEATLPLINCSHEKKRLGTTKERNSSHLYQPADTSNSDEQEVAGIGHSIAHKQACSHHWREQRYRLPHSFEARS
jgi:hypothetical protein